MRKLLFAVLGAAVCGCSYDDNELWKHVGDMEERIAALEEQVGKLNSDLRGLKEILDALDDGATVKNCEKTDGGWTLTLSDGTVIVLENGKPGADAPVIGVRQDTDGKYYWTLSVGGTTDWLTGPDGGKLPVTGPSAPVPVMGIDSDGHWTADYGDGPEIIRGADGQPVKAAGEAGDSFFRSVTEDDNGVYLTLTDGTVITLPKAPEAVITFPEGNRYTLKPSETLEIPFLIAGSGANGITVAAAAGGGWQATAAAEKTENGYAGTLAVEAPAEESSCQIILFAADGKGRTWMATVDAKVSTDVYTDLSAEGTANSYTVTQAGAYSFDASVRGNGAVAAGWGLAAEITAAPETAADWLWTTSADLLSEVKYDAAAKRITFAAGEAEGNAVIALYDESGILWSWHIWLTDAPEEMTYANGTTFMDRNLGAAGTTPGSADAYGLYYQWGRKDPFAGGTATETSAETMKQAKANTTVNPVFPDCGWEYRTGAGVSSVEWAAAHPMSFISNKTGTADYDWLTSKRNDLWGASKTALDPCPPGYKVPDADAWSDFASGRNYIEGVSAWDGTGYGMTYAFGGKLAWYPAQGYRNRDKGNLTGLGTTRTGRYWTNSPSASNASYLYFQKQLSSSSGSIDPQADNSRSYGYSVRCCRE